MSITNFYHVLWKSKSLMFFFFLLASDANAEGGAGNRQMNIWEVHPSEQVLINVDPGRVIRKKLPDTIFGFNVRWLNFEKDLWDWNAHVVRPHVIEALIHFPGALYRYPGGLVSNSFHWEDTIGPVATRKSINRRNKNYSNKPLFGIAEYFSFVKQVNGHPWYVLNLIGHGSKWGPSGIVEYPSEVMAQSNRKLAEYIRNNYSAPGITRYYQLGNELDRNIYQWGHKKYITRSLETINEIMEVDPEAKFVAFLRQFSWRYRGKARTGISKYRDFIQDVLKALPMVNDYSLHTYYDSKLRTGGKYKDIPRSLMVIERAIKVAKKVRRGKSPHVWITEHAKGTPFEKRKDIELRRNTSNILGTISTADFLIGLSQIPEIMGANWHGLNGVGRQLFDATMKYNDLRPRPVYWGLRVLRKMKLPIVLHTKRYSPNLNNYQGGYDVNAVGFTNTSRDKLALWAINRSNKRTKTKVIFNTFKGKKAKIFHYYVAGDGREYHSAEDINLDIQLKDKPRIGIFSNQGEIDLSIPPLSVSSYIINI